MSCIFLPFFSSEYTFFLGFQFNDHSIKPSLSHFVKVSSDVLQCLPFGGNIPFHSFQVSQFSVSQGACKGIVV